MKKLEQREEEINKIIIKAIKFSKRANLEVNVSQKGEITTIDFLKDSILINTIKLCKWFPITVISYPDNDEPMWEVQEVATNNVKGWSIDSLALFTEEPQEVAENDKTI
ncbi:hypothetical protein [Methanococcus voltae]|uniref:Uncharacterized protein n=1 Tax=Methanococcus voltae (strain ATCC BAA-1334 / A3) TaxID=456320 RepID=D7DSM4_METV3|nr:hypothetical protein [Methanococcus voltae]MCS3901733.1 hypothetical protein [Methanococcus voltae]